MTIEWFNDYYYADSKSFTPLETSWIVTFKEVGTYNDENKTLLSNLQCS